MQGAPNRPADPAVLPGSMRAAGVSFYVTVLHAPGKRLVKRFDANGRKHGYDNAAEFLIERHEARGFQGWCALLGKVERQPDRCVIRGAPGPWASPARPAYRLLHPQLAYTNRRGRRVTREEVLKAKRQDEIEVSLHPTTYLPMFLEEPTWWVLLDFEGIDFEPDWRRRLAETAAWLKLRLPDAFADVSCWFQATGGAADPTRPDLGGAKVRMRLGFLLSRPLTQRQLEAWLGGVAGLDPVTFRVVQPIYVGRPVFARGLADPIPVRSGVLEGLEEVVQVPDDLPAPRPQTGRWHVPAELSEGEGLGLLDCPELDEALALVSGDAGKTRSALGRAARVYIRAVGPRQVDVEALTQRLTAEGLKHRSPGEAAGYNLAALVRWHLARVPDAEAQEQAPPTAEASPELEALPDFGAVRTDRTAALAELHEEIDREVEAAAWRIALRKELKERLAEATAAEERTFLGEIHKEADQLDEREQRQLRAAKARASRAVKRAFLAERGLAGVPGRKVILFSGGQGTGKTHTVAKALARLGGGNVLVLVPTREKALELKEEIERHRPEHMFPFVWRGRLAPSPRSGEPSVSASFIDFNRRPTERMCGRPQRLIGQAQEAGVEMYGTFCLTCPLRHDCAYLDQIDTIKRFEGRRIVIAAHEVAFLPMPFESELAIVDEDLVTGAAGVIEIDPARLLDPEKWEKAPELEAIARAAAAALERHGEEFAALREAGVDEAVLKACASHLNALHEAQVEAIKEAGKGGASERTLEEMIATLKMAELRKLGALFGNLGQEIRTGRQGTNATRLVRARRKLVRQEDGSEAEERLDRYVISRLRAHRLGRNTELILLDGTCDVALARKVVGEDVQERRYALARRGVCIQITSTTNSKHRLLREHENAERARRRLRGLISNLSTSFEGSLLVGCTKKLREKLVEESALEELESMHFGAERGMNSAEHCEAVLVVGREQPQLVTLEDRARGFTVDSPDPFRSVLDAREEGKLPLYRRRRRMRDGSEVWAKVHSHPDPLARALLEQIREAAVVQMADRVRAIWHERVIIVATSLPVDLDVDLDVTLGDLMRAAAQAAAARKALDARGWWLQVAAGRNGAERIRVDSDETLIRLLLGNRPSLPQFPALLPGASGPPRQATLFSRLPAAEAFRRAAEVHPGLRAHPPPGGVLRECLRRHGLIVAWADLPAAVPELAPDAVAVAAVKAAEKDQLDQLRAGLCCAPYRVTGRRGRSGIVAWDPARIADPATALASLLHEQVMVDHPSPDPDPASASPETEASFMNPETWEPPPGVIEDDGEPPPLWEPPRTPAPPSPYVIAGLFRIGPRLVVDVVRPSAPPPDQQAKAA